MFVYPEIKRASVEKYLRSKSKRENVCHRSNSCTGCTDVGCRNDFPKSRRKCNFWSHKTYALIAVLIAYESGSIGVKRGLKQTALTIGV